MIRVPRFFLWLVICSLLLTTLSCLTEKDFVEDLPFATWVCNLEYTFTLSIETLCTSWFKSFPEWSPLATKTNHFADLYLVDYQAEGKVKAKKFPKTKMNMFVDNSAKLEAEGELTVDVELSLALLESDNSLPNRRFSSIKGELFVVSGNGKKTRVGASTARFKAKSMGAAVRFKKVKVSVGSHLQGVLSVNGGFVTGVRAIVHALVWYQGIPDSRGVNIGNSMDLGEDFSSQQQLQTRQINAVASTRRDYVAGSFHPGGKVKASKFPLILLPQIPIVGSANRWNVEVRITLKNNKFEAPKKNEQFKSMKVMLYDVNGNGKRTKVGTKSLKFDSKEGGAEVTFPEVKKPKDHFEAEIQFKGGLVKGGTVLVWSSADKAAGLKAWGSSSSSLINQFRMFRVEQPNN